MCIFLDFFVCIDILLVWYLYFFFILFIYHFRFVIHIYVLDFCGCWFCFLVYLVCSWCSCAFAIAHTHIRNPFFGGDGNGSIWRLLRPWFFASESGRERWRKFCNRNFGYQRTQFERVGMRRDVSNRRCCGMHDRPMEVLSIRVFKPHPSEFQLGNYKCAH